MLNRFPIRNKCRRRDHFWQHRHGVRHLNRKDNIVSIAMMNDARKMMKQAVQNLTFIMLKALRWCLDSVPRIIFNLWFRNDKRVLPPITNPLLLEPAISLAAKIRSRKLKSQVVIQAYIDRIKEVQPYLNAIVEDRFEDALKEAAKIDELLENSEKSPQEWAKVKPLLGVPVTCKDSVSIKGLCLTAGLVCRKGIKAESDAVSIALLREAGAIPLATTNVPELVMWFDSSNKLYGRTNNPYNFNRICGGSSGGEGCLISACGSVIGVGTDIGGSIRFPAFFCGIFGHKPTPRIVSSEGQYPPPSTDSVRDMSVSGPMCRYACDLIPMFKIMAGENALKLNLDQEVDLRSLRIYYMENEGGNPLVPAIQRDLKAALKKVLKHFKKSYGKTPECICPPQMKYAFKIWGAKLAVVKGGKTWEWEMGNREREVNPYPEFFKSLIGCSKHTMPIILLSIIEKLGGIAKESERKYYLELCEKLKEDLIALLGTDGVLLFPGNPETAPYHHETLWKATIVSYTGIFNALGFPVTMCPMGLASDGLPVGVQVVAAPHQDRLTLAVAKEIEKTFGGWLSPSRIITF